MFFAADGAGGTRDWTRQKPDRGGEYQNSDDCQDYHESLSSFRAFSTRLRSAAVSVGVGGNVARRRWRRYTKAVIPNRPSTPAGNTHNNRPGPRVGGFIST